MIEGLIVEGETPTFNYILLSLFRPDIYCISLGDRNSVLINSAIFSVPYRICSNEACRKTQNYDGSVKGILNMGDFLVGHDALRDYMHNFVTGNRYALHFSTTDYT